ncbi:asparagine synthase (glutamine-hydrolyzing) [Mucilaginibacter sabulilitoris]|uniref:asparagine synthase (glutamine-hydrolyzing) n=1 Tax=Mucilaginibacter sabulilitoris TaxID=1173583 RepID=A0ABZ0TS67_9SPHI|nr:asparagine synthase (glutamine-hydrolyzing) [Mucilaginibacter sabulilitoris]WPU95302.1 asparagine synthase (glutamine-hydrolyzing) [Mucilaginibacter sabulilitoris]
MCGIYGSTIYYNDDVVKAKLERIKFRGPDHSGFERVGSITLGHNRLAIVDLDPRSNQPFTYLHLKVVFNGEIYNYQQIKATLKTLGHVFQTDSDTEVLAAAYLEYGANCVEHFNGMFAFVIYDTKEYKLFGARDRLGKKPFYYAHNGLDFEFASQPSQITLGRQVNLDLKAINEYFVWGYVPEPRSAWEEISKLQAGYSFTFDIATGQFKTTKYWDLNDNHLNTYKGSYNQAQVELKELLTDAVNIRMHADVPLGVFLSGGIDSSVVAALAAANTKQVKTFCIKFNEKGFDESVFAGNIAKYLNTDHHAIECHYDEGMSLIGDFGRYYDEPFADSSAIPSLLLSKYTKKHVTVALSGDGGDESFMGYSRYNWLNRANKFFNCPRALRKAIAGLVKLSPNYRHKLIAMGIGVESIDLLYVLMLGGLEYSWLQQPELGLEVPFKNILSAGSGSFLQKMSAFDIKTYLNGDINTKVDRASMAFAVEARAPLMDHRIVTFAQQLPDSYKFGNGVQKKILKDILFEHVPASFFNRPKSGFSMPLKHWFRHQLKDYVFDNLSKSELENIPGINVPRTMTMIDEHMTGKWNRSSQIWKLLVFVQWLKAQKTSPVSEYQMV